MFEVSWSERGCKPDHKPHVFDEYYEAVKFLSDEIQWQAEELRTVQYCPESRSALEDLKTASDQQEFNFRIGRYCFWLVKIGGVV